MLCDVYNISLSALGGILNVASENKLEGSYLP